MMRYLLLLFSIVFCSVQAQEQTIPQDLIDNANSVLLEEYVQIDIPNQNSKIRKYHSRIKVLNRAGLSHAFAAVGYDKSRKVQSISARIMDANGKEIEKFKKKDFIDASAVDGGTLYSDDRVLFLNYTPTNYPFIIEFDYSIASDNTAFLPTWYVYSDYRNSVVSRKLRINYDPKLNLRSKVMDADGLIKIDQGPGYIQLTSSNIPAIEPEPYSPIFKELNPRVMLALNQFNLEGLNGNADNWKDYGKWEYDNLIKGLDELPESTIDEISKLVADAPTDKEKVKRIYKYMQDNTRYISVQLGIGGLKPYPAEEVEELGYGDCKGLTNYTMALLKSQGITSFYTEVWAGKEKRNIEADFASIQGNHVILNVPLEEEELWLECTSQTLPFNFLGSFTDDRDVVVLTPEGGVVKRTPEYKNEQNLLLTNGSCQLSEDGSLLTEVKMKSFGSQYYSRLPFENLDKDDKNKLYKRYWRYIDNISLTDIVFENDKEALFIEEDVAFSAKSYANFAGDKMLVPLNVLNRFQESPKRDKNRIFPILIERGFKDQDEITIALPIGYEVESLPSPVDEQTEFGSYSTRAEINSDGQVLFTRTLELKKGEYSNDAFSEFRSFLRKVVRSDNQKMVLIKK